MSFAPEGSNCGLYVFDFEKGTVGTRVHLDSLWSTVDGVAVAPRGEPVGRISMVEDSVKTALLTCLDVYESDRKEIRAIPRGAVRKVRFVEGLPPRTKRTAAGKADAAATALRILGEAPVEPDGSFLVQVPADTPFFIQMLDEGGRVLATMPTWIGLRPRDERSCMGCHEDKEVSPPNQVTQALLKAKPWSIVTPPAERRTVADWIHLGIPVHRESDIQVTHGTTSNPQR